VAKFKVGEFDGIYLVGVMKAKKACSEDKWSPAQDVRSLLYRVKSSDVKTYTYFL
jgi:hypothetical protein